MIALRSEDAATYNGRSLSLISKMDLYNVHIIWIIIRQKNESVFFSNFNGHFSCRGVK